MSDKKLQTISDPTDGLGPLEPFAASRRVYVEDGEICVPVREVTLSGGGPPVRV